MSSRGRCLVRTTAMALTAPLAVWILVAGLGNAKPASAQPSTYAGWDLRGVLPGQWEYWDDVLWRFRKGGGLDGSYQTLMPDVGGGEYMIVHDRGTWRMKGRQICVTWRVWFLGREQCYNVERQRGDWYLFTEPKGRYSFRATLTRR